MKTFLKILAVILVVFAALIIVLPIVFKGKIVELAKKEINNNVNATVDFNDMDLSLIRNFPNFSLEIDQLTVIGKGEFEQDTLVSIQSINVVIDLFSVFADSGYEVKKIILESPQIFAKITENGKENYDIGLPDEPQEAVAGAETGSGFLIKLNHFEIADGTVVYSDEEMNLLATLNGLNTTLSGNFTGDFSKLKLNNKVESLSVNMDGIDYLNKVNLQYKAAIEADLKNSIYTLGKNELKLNELQIGFNGSVSMLDAGYNLVLAFETPANRFKDVLSLVPAIYTKDFAALEADGKVSIDGSIKGLYSDEQLPSFNINLVVDNGMFTYPDLPKSVTNINVIANLKNKGGDADNTIINVSQFALNLGSNPFIASLLVKTPVSDPDLDLKVKGTIDLAGLKDFYPIEEELSGTFIADVSVNGKLSSIENQQYDKFVALGSVLVQNFSYSNEDLNKPIEISTAQLNFSPQYLDLVSFKMKAGKSNLTASGKITNYLAYAFNEGELKGKLTTKSTYFNIDELLAEEEEAEADTSETGIKETTEEPSGSTVVEVPGMINFTLNTSFDELIYDNIRMKNVKGKVTVADKVSNLDNLQMDVVEGLMTVSGNYAALSSKEAKVNLNFNLKNLNIPNAYNQFAVMKTYLPIAKKTTGDFSASFNLNTNLDEKMMPVYETMNGGGQLNTSKITVNDLNTLLQIAEALKLNKLKNLELNELLVKFQFIDGKMAVKPFDLKYKKITANVEGWTSFDQSIGYVMGINVPREELGADANKLMENMFAEVNKLGGNFTLPETISVDVLIGGTLTKPTIKTGLAESGNNIIEKAKEEVIKQISEEAREKAQQILAEADKQAKAIIAEAEKQAAFLRTNADTAVVKLNAETDKQANALMAEAKKQGIVAELAAKEAVKQLRKETGKQVQSLRTDADKKADALINTAKKTAKQIRDEAQKQADKLLKP